MKPTKQQQCVTVTISIPRALRAALDRLAKSRKEWRSETARVLMTTSLCIEEEGAEPQG